MGTLEHRVNTSMKLKRVMLTMFIVLLIVSPLSSQAVKEAQNERDHVTVNLGAMKGPSGFGVAGITQKGGVINEMASFNVKVHATFNEVIAKLANGELDMAFLPTNVAANLYAKGVPIKLAAVTGQGMLQFITTDPQVVEFEDLRGTSIAIPGAGGSPDQLTQIYFTAFGYDTTDFVTLDYSIASPAQLVQMYAAGKKDFVVLPEPFLSMAKAKQPKTIILLDYQSLWGALTGTDNYPMTVLVVRDTFIAEHPELVSLALDEVAMSIDWVNTNVEQAAQEIEKQEILSAELAQLSIPNCNLGYINATDAYESVDMYYNILYGFDYESIGSAVPNEDFYLEK
ncbi:MAG: ABC transporter substrate-binding protein [Spirochaetia bacterium]|nr:ABC transporter substrate-binding protein [Spirochaetia bacterium]